MKTITKYLLPIMALAMVACNHNNQPSLIEAPHWKVTYAPLEHAPAWKVSNMGNYPSSMTITAKLPISTTSSFLDSVAAILYSDDDVMGVCSNEGEGFFSLYMHGPQECDLYPYYRLCYYSRNEQQIYVTPSDDSMIFENDAILGTNANPATFQWIACGPYTRVQKVSVYLLHDEWTADDELSLWVDGECRQVEYETRQADGFDAADMWLPFEMKDTSGKCLFYNADKHKVDTLSFDISSRPAAIFIP